MSAQLVTELTILMLAIFLGFEVISKVPTLLHTPLMSGTNAIHGIVIVGAIIVAGSHHPGLFMQIVAFVAILASRPLLSHLHPDPMDADMETTGEHRAHDRAARPAHGH